MLLGMWQMAVVLGGLLTARSLYGWSIECTRATKSVVPVLGERQMRRSALSFLRSAPLGFTREGCRVNFVWIGDFTLWGYLVGARLTSSFYRISLFHYPEILNCPNVHCESSRCSCSVIEIFSK